MSISNIQFSNLQNKANEIEYAIAQYLMLNVNTISPCEIIAVKDNSYDVQILTNYLMANNKPVKPSPIYEIPKIMLMGGKAGVIVELEQGDKALVGFCQRDISIVKKQWDNQNPGSLRKFDMRDGIILGVLSNILPATYVKITSNGIEIKGSDLKISTDNSVEVTSPKVKINSSNITLGNSGTGVLTGSTTFQVSGVMAGDATLPVTIASGISTSVIAQS